ncbi:MAG: SDR family oxidoreductase [Actinomycetota bacterium]|nr:SDR family oxidoreductase [Actinomycetota bacterium]MDQ3720844.1 SDR family oxidoreductase [Actinomycetota bacterium]
MARVMPDEFERQQENRPAQHQPRQPGLESQMDPKPVTVPEHYRGTGKLEGRVALVTGGDSGIGRAVSVLFAREGADVAVGYLDEDEDAAETARLVEAEGRRCVTLPCDLREEEHCRQLVQRTVDELGRLDVLVNHAGEQHPRDSIEDVSAHQLERTFQLNVFAMFHLVKAALAHLGEGSAIVNTASVTAYQGNPSLIDYTAANGAIVAFTRALSNQLIERGIRVNAVAPGPVWTPLIPATFPADKVEDFGAQTPLGRIGQPAEIAPSYVFLASEDSSFMSGQVLHPNGGSVVGG